MTDAERLDKLKRLRELKQRREMLSYQPKQELAQQLSEQADLLLYGGAAGGGKSEFGLRHVVREMVDHPYNFGVVFRRTFPSLESTLIPRAKKMLMGWAEWNGAKHTFTFPNGSILRLASLQYADSVADHQGAEYGVIFFEEITEFEHSQFDFLKGRLRAPADGIRPHLIATTNPGGVGHYWVRRYWQRPTEDELRPGQSAPAPLEIWTPAPTDVDPDPMSRVFVPAWLSDNPILAERDPGYINRIRSIQNTGLRRALEHGDWDAIEMIEGALWSMDNIDKYRVKKGPEDGYKKVVVSVDPSKGAMGGDEQGIVVTAQGWDGENYVLADLSTTSDPNGWGRISVQAFLDYEADVIVAERNYGGEMVIAVVKAVAKDMGVDVTVKEVNASRGKRVRAEPIAALYSSGRVHHIGTHDELEQQMTTWTPDHAKSPDRMDAVVWGLTHLNPVKGKKRKLSFAGVA